MSRMRELGSPRTDKITDFLDTYHDWLSDSVPYPYDSSVNPGGIRWLAAYHLSVARPLARLFSKWALANLRKAASTSTIQDGEAEALLKLSDNDIGRKEARRFVFSVLYIGTRPTITSSVGIVVDVTVLSVIMRSTNSSSAFSTPGTLRLLDASIHSSGRGTKTFLTRSKRTCIPKTLDLGKRMEFTTKMDRSILLWNMMVSMISHRTSRTENPRCATLVRNNSHLLT